MEPGWRSHFARALGVARGSYYSPAKRQLERDSVAVIDIKKAHTEHPYYGVRRLALHLSWSRNKTRRIRSKAEISVSAPSKRRRTGSSEASEISAPTNALKEYASFRDATKPQEGMSYMRMVDVGGWVQDFTYLWFDRRWHYLAAVLELKTRRVVGWRFGLRHSSELTLTALLDALSKHPAPLILHSDQGSEYLSYKHQLLCQKMAITLSCSSKGSPWQNGFMERFFGTLKQELGPLRRYTDLAQLHEAIALTIHYYNTKRIHSALNMSPAAYAAGLMLTTDKVFEKKVA